MDKLKAMANFVRIVDNGSLSAAADASQSVASVVRSLAALERHLGVRLLNRSTRRMALTDEGRAVPGLEPAHACRFADIEQRRTRRTAAFAACCASPLRWSSASAPRHRW